MPAPLLPPNSTLGSSPVRLVQPFALQGVGWRCARLDDFRKKDEEQGPAAADRACGGGREDNQLGGGWRPAEEAAQEADDRAEQGKEAGSGCQSSGVTFTSILSAPLQPHWIVNGSRELRGAMPRGVLKVGEGSRS